MKVLISLQKSCLILVLKVIKPIVKDSFQEAKFYMTKYCMIKIELLWRYIR